LEVGGLLLLPSSSAEAAAAVVAAAAVEAYLVASLLVKLPRMLEVSLLLVLPFQTLLFVVVGVVAFEELE